VDQPGVVESEPDRYAPVDAPEARTFPEPGGEGGRGYEPVHPRSGLRDLLRTLGAPFVALGVFLLKFGGLLLKLKVVTTGASMLVSIAAYAWIWGLPFAIGFVLLILVHELGHVLELRRQGVPASAPLFIPFLGAVVGMRELPDDAWKEAKVALAGPLLGSLGAAACWVAGEATGSELLVALAFVGFFLNLFNLLPISPLDGGRIVGVIGRWLWALGYVLGIGALVVTRSPMLFLILLFSLFNLRRTLSGPHADYFAIARGRRLVMGAAYFGLVIALALGMWLAERPLATLPTDP